MPDPKLQPPLLPTSRPTHLRELRRMGRRRGYLAEGMGSRPRRRCTKILLHIQFRFKRKNGEVEKILLLRAALVVDIRLDGEPCVKTFVVWKRI